MGIAKENLGKKKGSATTATTENTQESSPNNREDDEEITPGKFPFVEIFPAFKGAQFDPDIMNIFTGRIMSNSHHMKGEGAKSKRDFQKFKACFCLEWIPVYIDALPYWVRCGNMFNLFSQGCIVHSRSQYKDGPNRIYYLLSEGNSGNWGMLKNLRLKEEEVGPTREQTLAKAQEDAEMVGEQIAVAAKEGKSLEELQTAHQELLQIIAKLYKEKANNPRDSAALQQFGMSKAAPAASAQVLLTTNSVAPIYGSRRRPGDSAPGNSLLDKKRVAMNDSNHRFKCNKHFGTLDNVPEEG
jgi:hypothetical protein